jgi:hypothetical protein
MADLGGLAMPASAFEPVAPPPGLGPGEQEPALHALAPRPPSRSSSTSAGLQHPNVFVRGLPLAWSEAEITAVFQQYGELTSMRLVRHSVTKQSLGCALLASPRLSAPATP